MNTFIRRLARPLEFLLGVTFLIAAVLKALDPNLFAAQIYSYRLVQEPGMLTLVALGTLGVETFLGVAMILGLRLRMLVLAVVQATLVFFTLVILYAWTMHGLKDCGCFGRVTMTPAMAITKNLIMMGAAAIAWRGIRLRDLVLPGGALWRTTVSAILAVGMTVYAMPALHRDAPLPPDPAAAPQQTPEAMPAPPRPFAQFQVETEVGDILDLGQGEYLVAVLSSVCDHCMSMVPHLNELSFYPELPPVVGLMYTPDEASLEIFKLQVAPLFPIHSLGNNFIKFSEFIGNAPPRLTHVRDGAIVHSWDVQEHDTEFATVEEILEVIAANAPGEP